MSNHLMRWGSRREGMSYLSAIGKVALLENNVLCLVTEGALLKEGNLPPGFVRFLTDEEVVERGLTYCLPRLLLRHGSRTNGTLEIPLKHEMPYYRRLEKRKHWK